MPSAVTLSAATRQNLLSLQDTAALASTNQNRLSTGKKVNTALDNPVNFFTASSLTDRAAALSGLLGGISNGIQTIQAAAKGVDTLTALVKQMQSVVSQAQSNATTNLPKLQGTQAVNRRPKGTQDRRPKGTHRPPRMSANAEADVAQPVGSA
ncbi:flagellin N-terminal helical domain-containing protein, partial [Methylobacterium hispanicum]|uniref:flagellin N-terminal helical domain-containing protein n=1 Tax=Methylobacterium hispanicum TaxID=270350 RepID=UPI00402BB7DD